MRTFLSVFLCVVAVHYGVTIGPVEVLLLAVAFAICIAQDFKDVNG